MTAPSTRSDAQSIDLLLERLAAIDTHVAYLASRQHALDEVLAEVGPIARVAMDGAVETFSDLERAGWFTFARELRSVAERVLSAYTTEDLRQLGGQVVGIFDTIRNLTQPDVLAMMNQATAAVHEANDADPHGMWGVLRATKDPDVRKGIGVLLAVMKQVGRAADQIAQTPQRAPLIRVAAYAGKDGAAPPTWVQRLAPRRAPKEAAPSAEPAPTLAPRAAPATSSAAMPAGYGADGFLKDPASWTRALATELAALMPLTLTDAHWRVIEWARAEHAAAGASPNIRRLSLGAEVSVRELYALFPGKPGVLVAMLAGIPKPGGCI